MDFDERRATIQLISWFYQTTSQNAVAVALAAAGIAGQLQKDEDEAVNGPYRASKRFTIFRGMPDLWLPEAQGGINDELFEFFTRFRKAEMLELAESLDLPVKFGIDQNSGWPLASTNSPAESLLIFCWRAAHPLALGHLISVFGRSRSWLSRVWNGVLRHIWGVWGSRIEWDHKLMSRATIEACCRAVGSSLGAEQGLIFGFIDGTEVAVCRPMFADQSLYYSGHKKQHALAHLAIILPNGLFGSVFSGVPVAGGDASLCVQVQLGKCLGELLEWLPEGECRYVYGDAAFGSQDFVLGPYKRANNRILTPTQKKINQWLSTKRIVVEHGFGGVKMAFKLLQLRTSLVTGLAPIGLYLPVFSFLYNCRTCIRGGNEISQQFSMATPSLEEFVSGKFQEIEL